MFLNHSCVCLIIPSTIPDCDTCIPLNWSLCLTSQVCIINWSSLDSNGGASAVKDCENIDLIHFKQTVKSWTYSWKNYNDVDWIYKVFKVSGICLYMCIHCKYGLGSLTCENWCIWNWLFYRSFNVWEFYLKSIGYICVWSGLKWALQADLKAVNIWFELFKPIAIFLYKCLPRYCGLDI